MYIISINKDYLIKFERKEEKVYKREKRKNCAGSLKFNFIILIFNFIILTFFIFNFNIFNFLFLNFIILFYVIYH